jgi:tocopherol cyclase
MIYGYNRIMKNYLSKIKHPFQFQGSFSKKNYFEGWYYKQVHLSSDKTISFIFGISTGTQDPHSFIQVIQSNPLTTAYFRFPLKAFQMNGTSYIIDKNRFSLTELELHLSQDDLQIDGVLHLSDHTFLDHQVLMPNIMGPFAYLPNMECNHGVVSMGHTVDGSLIINHVDYHFKREKGYLEKDWGISFPKRYIWIQGNHFENPKVGFMTSIADIPFLGLAFEGIICQLDLGHRRLRFATYNGSKVSEMKKTEDGFEFTLRKRNISLQVIAHVPVTGVLKSPHLGSMVQTIKEGLGGSIELILKEKGQETLKMSSDHCGIEIEAYLKD